MIAVVTASTVVAYAVWTASPEVRDKLGSDKLYLTLPFVLFGIFRYLYLVHSAKKVVTRRNCCSTIGRCCSTSCSGC